MTAVRVLGRGVLVFAALYLAVVIQTFIAFVPVSILLARTAGGDLETVATTVATALAMAAVVGEVVAVFRWRPGLAGRWKVPGLVAAALVGVLAVVVLFWEHVYPCSAC